MNSRVLIRNYPAVFAFGSALAAQSFAYNPNEDLEAYRGAQMAMYGISSPGNSQPFGNLGPASILLISNVETPLRLKLGVTDVAGYELDHIAIEALGVQSYLRLREFRQLRAGWSFGYGVPLSVESLENMEKFLSGFGEILKGKFRNPLIYLNREGELELIWKGDKDAEIFVRFHASKVDYLISPGDIEGTNEPDGAGLLIQETINSGLAA